MMKIAVTKHAVERYRERVPDGDFLEDESIRDLIRELVNTGFEEKTVRDHPVDPTRKVVPFKSGESQFYLSLAPNTTGFPGDLAVVGVLYDTEVGKASLGVTLGDAKPMLRQVQLSAPKPPLYIVKIGIETYTAKDDDDLADLLQRRQPRAEDVLVYKYQEVKIKTQYVIERAQQARTQ